MANFSLQPNQLMSGTLDEDMDRLYPSYGKLVYEGIVHTVSNDSYDDIQPGKNDVLCGRDKYSYGHVGNKRFRVIIAMNRERYQNAAHRDQKTRITKEIVESIASSGGRFLRQDPKTKEWEDVTEVVGHEKVSHALRSAKDPSQKRPRKKRKVVRKKHTEEENQVFEKLLAEQQRIFKNLLVDEETREMDKFKAPREFTVTEWCGV